MKTTLRSRILSAIFAFVAVLSLIPAMNLSADAATTPRNTWIQSGDTVYIKSRDVSTPAYLGFKSSGLKVWNFECINGGSYGKGCNSYNAAWKFTDAGGGYFYIQTARTGPTKNTLTASANGSVSCDYYNKGSNAQKWRLEWYKLDGYSSPVTFKIISVSTGMELKVTSNSIYLVRQTNWSNTFYFYNF